MRPHALIPMVLALLGCAGAAARGRPWVHALRLEGVRQVDRGDLEKKLGVEATSWNPLAPKRYLDPFAVTEDQARIEAFYRARGYYGARVTAAQVLPRRGGASVDVRFVVDEGLPTVIDDVVLAGLDDLAAPLAAQVLARIAIARGQRFDSDRYLQTQDTITGALKDLGYPWARVTGRAEVDRDRRRCLVRYTVDHGPRADVDGVEVRGTVAVDAARVAAETRIDRGDPFRLTLLEDARRRIYHLGVFSSVKVRYEPVAGQPHRVRLVVDVKESTFNELRLGVGFGIDPLHQEVHLTGVYVRHNFLGGLRTLRLQLTPAYVVIPAIWNVQRHGPALTAEGVLTQPRAGFLSQIQWTLGYDLGVEYAAQYQGPRTSLGAARLVW
ncbi:MAG TPA: POTRA domain-containing protein, partial [Polyangia bacterium]